MLVYSARDIAKQLADRADAFCRWLLPNGVMHSGNWCLGSVAGEAGNSLRIQISGTNAGVWADFATDQSGDLLGLIKEVRQVDIRGAISTAKEWLGIREPESHVPEKSYGRPNPKEAKETKDISSLSPVESYLMEQRGLDFLTISQYRIKETANGEIVFQSFSPQGELENLKYIAVRRDERGKKIVRQSKGCPPALFGWQAIDPNARELLIAEGEIDAMTWSQMGFPAVSVPMGAGNHQWIDYEWERLLQFDLIYLSYDGDTEGRDGAAKAAKRLGLHRCMLIKLGDYKDANEALTHNEGPCFFNHAITTAKAMEPDQIKRPVAFRDRVVEKFYPPDDVPPGFAPHMFKGKYRARPGEVTVWTGISSHGKSALLSQLMLEAALGGYKVAIASMEMRGEQTLHRMISQAEIRDRPPLEHIDAILHWMSGKLWIYDLIGNVVTAQLLMLMEYSFARHGVDQFVIDSLMKTSIISDDYDGQRVFLNQLCTFAHDTNAHIHLVAHARKGRDESAPGKLDVKGSSDIINEPDNVISVWRNRGKERALGAGVVDDHSTRTQPDTIVYCEKQRETGEEFYTELRFFRHIFRYRNMDEKLFPDLRISTRVFGHTPAPDEPPAPAQPEPDMFESETTPAHETN